MKVTIEYDGIEEQDDATDAINIVAWRSFVWNFEQELHKRWKWGEFEHDETHKLIEELWERWHELKSDLPRGGE